MERMDAQLSEFLSGWSIYTTIIALVIVTWVAYPLLTSKDPDTHPFLLARQSTASPVRQPGESAIYRSLEAPHGYPLRSGLSVKDKDAPKWSSGRNGDLRDVWRQAIRGVVTADGVETGLRGKILTVLGREKVVEHNLDDLSREINVVGQYIREHSGRRVAICLPNSIELLSSIFAAAFYGFTPILIPYGRTPETLFRFLQNAEPDVLIAEAGALHISEVIKGCPSLAQVVWVAQRGGRHMDWNEVPEGVGGRVGISVWHELVDDKKEMTGAQLPANAQVEAVPGILTFWPSKEDSIEEMTEFSQKNMVAAIAALNSALPRNERIKTSDVFLPIDSLTFTYPLALTMGIIFSNASLALNSVAGVDVDFALATAGVTPTLIVASSQTVANAHAEIKKAPFGYAEKREHWLHDRTLKAGRMPTANLFIKESGPIRHATGNTAKLRLLYVSERVGATPSPPLSSTVLSDMRIFTGARVVYALTAAKVAGAVAQTNFFDYRKDEPAGKSSHFGPPLSSVEVRLVDTSDHKTTDEGNPQGQIIVKGPAVAGGEANLGVVGTFGDDSTLAYV
ncbi:MAG: hypothetical protein M1830_000934 [Pleopsidium flavum]|nr:MAG: hypothetical protein M1830_000934 [Pleopsidium flavum]